MYHSELISIYEKTIKVIHSCNTISQYNTAVKYSKLFLKLIPTKWDSEVRGKLKKVLSIQKHLVKPKRG